MSFARSLSCCLVSLVLIAPLAMPLRAQGESRADGVVTLAPHLAELVCAVGACERLVGVDGYSDYPPELKQRPVISDAFSVNYEAVLALRPQRVLAWDGGTRPEVIMRLRALGLHVDLVKVDGVDDVGQALLRVGALLGTEDAACEAEAAYRERITALRARYRDAAAIRMLYQLGREPVYTIGALSPINEAIEICGGVNVFANLGSIAGAVSREAVIAANPEVIAFGEADEARAIRADWARYPQMRAVASNNLLAVNADLLSRATPRMADGIDMLCRALDTARQHLRALPPVGTRAP